MFIRSVKVPSSSGAVNEYLRIVESYRDGSQVKQRTITDLGRKDVLQQLLPKLKRILEGRPRIEGQDDDEDIKVHDASTWGPVLVVRTLFEELGLWSTFEELLGSSKSDVSYSDRAFVLIANRLICPRSEHGLASWLESDFVCDRQGRRFVPRWRQRRRVRVHHQQLQAWYRTLDRLLAAKETIEVRLYERLRDLFSFEPDLVLYDITSTYFEGAGPADFAKHGYSRDGKSQNVQVIVGMVMVNGWPIAHHVWEGNRVDQKTVQEVVSDLMERFSFARLVFVGDRGMVSEENLEQLREEGHGYLVGLKRRRNQKLAGWLHKLDESKWRECVMGINTQESKNPPRTRVQEVDSGDDEHRVFVIDSDERRAYEESKRTQAMERVRVKLQSVQRRVAEGKLTKAAAIGAAAARALQAHHGYRYFGWKLSDGVFTFFEHPVHFENEKRLEGKYVIATSEKDLSAEDAVAMYKELMDVERSFRNLKDVLAMRPIYHRVQPRVKAHIFVAALALLLQCLLDRQLRDGEVSLSATTAMQAVQTIRHVTFEFNGEKRSGVSAASADAHRVLKALGIRKLRPPKPPASHPTVM